MISYRKRFCECGSVDTLDTPWDDPHESSWVVDRYDDENAADEDPVIDEAEDVEAVAYVREEGMADAVMGVCLKGGRPRGPIKEGRWYEQGR